MGHRANYVIIEGGQSEIYFSRWGALDVPAVLLSGPEATVAYVRSLTPDDHLLDDDWAEGGMALRLDKRELRFFGGINVDRCPYLRRPLLRALRRLWSGWSVEWASFGIADLALSMGSDVRKFIEPEFDDHTLLENTEPTIHENDLRITHELRRAQCVLSVRWPSGAISDYLLTPTMISALALGPHLLEIVASIADGPITVLPREDDPDLPGEGAYMDTISRDLWMCGYYELNPRHLPAMALRWPGWHVQGDVGGFVRQIELSGRNSAPMRVPEERAIEELTEELTHTSSVDPHALYAAITPSGPSRSEREQTVTVGKGFFSADQPPLSPEQRREVIRRLLRADAEDSESASHGE